jgi:Zn-dependent peptidase ImmA (M78 family)
LPSNSSIEELILRKIGVEWTDKGSKSNKTEVINKLRKTLDGEIETLLKENRMLDPPFDPRKIKKIGQAAIDVRPLPRNVVGADGSLETTNEGFLLSIADNLVKEDKYFRRLRSTIVHELMHTFFYDTTSLPPVKLGKGKETQKDFLMEEELCCYLAREFLMPKFVVLDKTRGSAKSNPSLKNIELLKSLFKVSSDIVAYRMIIDLSLWDGIFIKSMKEGSLYKLITRLKSKLNPFYNNMKIPRYIPERDSRSKWIIELTQHIQNTLTNGEFQELITVGNQNIALESRIETLEPLCIETIAYEERA